MTEGEFQRQVIQLAVLFGWRVHHVRPARVRVRGKETYRTPVQGHKGFPDLVLARRGRVIFAELKAGRGQLSEDQVLWRDAMDGGQAAEYAGWKLWRPEDWADIERILR